MNRRYASLQPRVSSESSDSENLDNAGSHQLAKRRRITVKTACTACRRRKGRCDGLKPECSACQMHKSQCSYERGPLTPNAKLSIVEVVTLLNSLPPGETIRMLAMLKTETSAASILSILNGGMDSKQRPSEAALAASMLNRTFESMELEAQNPKAYPTLSSVGSEILRSSKYSRLLRSRGGTSALPLETLPAQQSYLWPEVDRASAPDSSDTLEGMHTLRLMAEDETLPLKPLCDDRLHQLDIGFWTKVEISNELAAQAISLYLETDHPLLGHFDPDLFLTDLICKKYQFCSSVLVNALLYWASQMYATVKSEMDALSSSFRMEAERLWQTEQVHDSILNMAAAQFLSMAYLGQGKPDAVVSYLAQASSMGSRLRLFGVEGISFHQEVENVDSLTLRAYMHTAWGVFNWVILISLFYHQPGLGCPRYPPWLPIPGDRSEPAQNTSSMHRAYWHTSYTQPEYMGDTFPYICKFWHIMHDVVLVYYKDDSIPLRDQVALNFAEYKFRELLAWSNTLPPSLARQERSPHHVIVLHLWFHAAILDVFRPCLISASQTRRRLRTFSSIDSSPDAVYAASVRQLIQLIITYRMNYESSAYTILWHTALTYVAYAVLQNTQEEGWFLYFLLCIYGYEGLHRSWRVVGAIIKGLLSMTMRNGDISSNAARRIMYDMQLIGIRRSIPGEIHAPFMMDLDLAMTDMPSATVANLAASFEKNAAFRDFTAMFDHPVVDESIGGNAQAAPPWSQPESPESNVDHNVIHQ